MNKDDLEDGEWYMCRHYNGLTGTAMALHYKDGEFFGGLDDEGIPAGIGFCYGELTVMHKMIKDPRQVPQSVFNSNDLTPEADDGRVMTEKTDRDGDGALKSAPKSCQCKSYVVNPLSIAKEMRVLKQRAIDSDIEIAHLKGMLNLANKIIDGAIDDEVIFNITETDMIFGLLGLRQEKILKKILGGTWQRKTLTMGECLYRILNKQPTNRGREDD